MNKAINEAIFKAVGEKDEGILGFLSGKNLLDRPGDLSHGDYSTNIAMILAPKLGVKPIELAGDIVEKMQTMISEGDFDGVE
ncbi:MAG: hypothetical protein WCO09_05255, partial [bacterium]